jgi:acetyl-CoA synthetase
VSDTIDFAGVLVDLEVAEGALTTRADVREAVAVGVTDNYLGQALQLYVVLEEGIVPSNELRTELLTAVADRLDGLRPRQLRFADRLPHGEDGRPARAAIRGVVMDEPFDASAIDDVAALEAIRRAR